MKATIIRRIMLLIFSLVMLSGCRNGSPGEAASLSPDDLKAAALSQSETLIEIEGNLVPRTVINLAFAIPGAVQELLAAEGDRVAEGQLTATLGDSRQAEAAVAVRTREYHDPLIQFARQRSCCLTSQSLIPNCQSNRA